MAKLGPEQITERLKKLSGWELKDNAITKRYKFKAFMDGIRFVSAIAEIAERMDHHPDILINYIRITFSCSTHDEGGITEKDFKLATEIENAFKKSGQEFSGLE
jgi:4a-hydroxytetrahydrobiopterin dehydratase